MKKELIDVTEAYFIIKAYASILGISCSTAMKKIDEHMVMPEIMKDKIVEKYKEILINGVRNESTNNN